MAGDPPPPDPHPGGPVDDAPVIPHAAPLRDAQGRLTYIGEDGRRYIVAPPPPGALPERDG